MKTEQEIREEIEVTKRTISDYCVTYKENKITREMYLNKLIDCESTIDALLWVLGENDRYD